MCDSGGTIPAYQEQSLEFKPQHHQNNNNKTRSVSVCLGMIQAGGQKEKVKWAGGGGLVEILYTHVRK
jgi:hypothetical protein